jgi:hypothetical protein
MSNQIKATRKAVFQLVTNSTSPGIYQFVVGVVYCNLLMQSPDGKL